MRRTVVVLCAIVLAVVFAAAGLPKIMSPHDFAVSVFRYQILPYGVVNLVALYLPWMEGVAALALLAPGWRRGAALLLFLMLAVFTAALVFNLARGLNVSCGCFTVSADAEVSDGWNVLRNVLLMAAALVVLWPRGRMPTTPKTVPARTT